MYVGRVGKAFDRIYDMIYDMIWHDMIYDIITAIGLTPDCSSTVHIYTQTIHRTTQLTTLVGRFSGIRAQNGHTKINDELTAYKLSPNLEECGPCPVFASHTLASALQLRKKARKTSVRIVEECQLARWKQNRTYTKNRSPVQRFFIS
jgi:hypothetical protein